MLTSGHVGNLLRVPSVRALALSALLLNLSVLHPQLSSTALADDTTLSGARCLLTVRLVAASGKSEAEGHPTLQTSSFQMSSWVADADEQLQGLPYTTYRLLAMREATASEGHKARFMLSSEESPRYEIAVTPKSVTKEKICLRVDWREENGREIVSTRINVPDGENVVLGSDRVAGGPLLVIIKPLCH